MSSNLFSIFVNGNTIISVTWATVLVGISTPAYPLPTKSPPPGKYALCLLNLLLPHYCLSVTISASVPLFSMLPTSAIHISSDDSSPCFRTFYGITKRSKTSPFWLKSPSKFGPHIHFNIIFYPLYLHHDHTMPTTPVCWLFLERALHAYLASLFTCSPSPAWFL